LTRKTISGGLPFEIPIKTTKGFIVSLYPVGLIGMAKNQQKLARRLQETPYNWAKGKGNDNESSHK
jgi:hypothetical protein